MKLVLGDKSLWIIIISWVFILGYISNAVISAEYYTTPEYYYNDGGQIVNVTMLDGEYVYLYTDGEGYGTGKTEYKIVIGDIFIRYDVKDGIDIPIIYPARIWQELRLNDVIKESTEHHLPLNILIGLYLSQLLILTVVILKTISKHKK